MNIRMGIENDIDTLEKLYDDINYYLAAGVNYPGWKKGIYPARQDAIKGVNEGCLYVAEENGKIVGSFILRHKPEPAYLQAEWQRELEYSEVLVVYTFVVNPKWLRRGIGGQMLAEIARRARDEGIKALRLDVYSQNLPAISLYEKCGYKYIDTVSLGLEEYGLDWFKLYEKLL